MAAASSTVRPSLFIGSSGEGLEVARAVQALMDRACEVEVWSQGVFGLSQGTLESLVLALPRFDFAVLVLTANDTLISRGDTRPAARDNVIFELGLFIGALGRERTFMVYDRTAPPALPSDLLGITAADFEPHRTGNLEAALGAASHRIQQAVAQLGIRESKRARRMDEAASTMESAGAQMHRLIQLMARSRKVELDIISAQFGPFIDPGKLGEMRRDLEDLDDILRQQMRDADE